MCGEVTSLAQRNRSTARRLITNFDIVQVSILKMEKSTNIVEGSFARCFPPGKRYFCGIKLSKLSF